MLCARDYGRLALLLVSSTGPRCGNWRGENATLKRLLAEAELDMAVLGGSYPNGMVLNLGWTGEVPNLFVLLEAVGHRRLSMTVGVVKSRKLLGGCAARCSSGSPILNDGRKLTHPSPPARIMPVRGLHGSIWRFASMIMSRQVAGARTNPNASPTIFRILTAWDQLSKADLRLPRQKFRNPPGSAGSRPRIRRPSHAAFQLTWATAEHRSPDAQLRHAR